MPHSYYSVWIHVVFATKDRKPLIKPEIENHLYGCLYREFSTMDCSLKIVNGLSDHVHCLFTLSPQKSLSEVIKHIKGLSSHFINQQFATNEKFTWQKGYAAFSVSDYRIEVVCKYIREQKLKSKSLEEEGFNL